MSLQPPRDIQVVKKENKAAWLEDFIRTHATNLATNLAINSATKSAANRAANRAANAGAQSTEQTGAVDIAVFARSIESPVIQALANRCAQFPAASTRIRIILTGLEIEEIDTSTSCAALERAGAAVRVVTDPRLLDAHEQMTLHKGVSWIGDCLRREPAKRDAYERYAPNCIETWTGALATFEMIWARATDFALPGIAHGPCEDLPTLGIDASGVAGEHDGATAATRH